MVTRNYMVNAALSNSHRTVGHAFCKALGVLHLIRKTEGKVFYQKVRTDGLLECFTNKANPNDIRLRKEV